MTTRLLLSFICAHRCSLCGRAVVVRMLLSIGFLLQQANNDLALLRVKEKFKYDNEF